ncbi:ABC transporter ATP-binding protein [Sporolactobacillus shoreae]|uniref:ABC transporter ATP-binding protein n=1 Tax=Sporolactobacillus shoreae TaxID=1465501 RepID=A0A4Z0GRA8_9BACL|nr:ATP-binding cassette domain-containing protein [Sporolactobacillus shoreae]TGA98976.1 ABC transporter ATP-binding protein [Sporolactobacillus shoreae]
MSDQNVLLQVKGLKKFFSREQKGEIRAVNNINFDIVEGETLGLVGESGCGKTTTGRCIVKLYHPTNGEIIFDGKDIARIRSKRDQLEFCRNVQMIFQDPYASLDPKKKVQDIIGEGIDVHHLAKSREDRNHQIRGLLATVGLNPEHAGRYPHEFSGGQRQRIGIARALAVKPKLIVCDEPISALDVSIQAQVVNLLKKLQKERNLTYLFIAHDLSMVKYISDRIAVMYRGVIVELGDTDELYHYPIHRYTKSLLSAIPHADPYKEINRSRIIYQFHEGDLNGELHEIGKGHFVLSQDNQVEAYKEQLKNEKKN